MKKSSQYFAVLLFLIVFVSVHSQNRTIKKDSASYFKIEDPVAFKYILNNEFSKLITGSALGGLGNYAAVSTANNNLKASINIVREHKIIGISIAGGVSDDVSNIISNSELNSNVNLGITYHRLFHGTELASYITGIDDINKKSEEIINTYKNEVIKAKTYLETSLKTLNKKKSELNSINKKINNRENPDASKIAALEKQKLSYEQELKLLLAKRKFYSQRVNKNILINKAMAKRDKPSNQDPFKQELFESEKHKIEALEHFYNDSISLKKKTIGSIKGKIEGFSTNKEKLKVLYAEKSILEASLDDLLTKRTFYADNINEIITRLSNKKESELQKNYKNLKSKRATDLKIEWFSMGIEAKYQTYNLFDEGRPDGSQFYDEKDLVPKFFMSFSGYLGKPVIKKKKASKNKLFLIEDLVAKHVSYYSFGIVGTYGNNINGLESVEIKDTETLSDNREIIRTRKAFIGEFEEQELSGQVFGEYYQFVGNKDNIGFHLKGTLNLGEFKPVTSVRAGLILPFSKIEDTKSNVNLELFVGLNDIFNKTSDRTVLGRNVVGVQATFPLNFNL